MSERIGVPTLQSHLDLAHKYETLLQGYHRQEATMKEVAEKLRHEGPVSTVEDEINDWLVSLADILDPPEPVHPDDK